MLELERIVRIEASFEHLGEPKRGTGYLLTADRVLTARHVVRDEDAEPIEVRILEDTSEGDRPLEFERIAWCGPAHEEANRDVDVALLEIESVGVGVEPPRFLAALRHGSAGFESRGWIWTEEGAFSATTFSACALPFLAHQRCEIEIVVHPHGADGWCGISGAPVFLAGGLLGVIVDARGEFRGGKVTAVPAVAFSADPDFRAELGNVCRRRERERLLAAAEEVLGSRAREALFIELKEMGLEAPESLEDLVQRESTATITRALCETHSTLLGVEDLEAAAAIENLALHLLAILCEGELPMLWDCEPARLGVASKTLVEAARSAFDGRPAAFEHLTRPEELPQPRYAIRPTLEAGIDPHNRQKMADLAEQFWETARHDPPQSTAGRWIRGGLSAFAPPSLLSSRAYRRYSTEKKIEFLRRAINDFFEEQAAARGGPKHFLIVEDEFAEECPEFLQELSIVLPHLAQTRVADDPLQALEEEKPLKPLGQLLYNAYRHRRR